VIIAVIIIPVLPSFDVHAQQQSAVRVLKTFGYLSDQQYIVYGEVVNENGAVQFVEVVAQFLDQELKPLATLSASTAIERLNPGQVTPFSIVLSDAQLAPLVRSYTVNIGTFNPAEAKPAKLDIIFHKVETSTDIVTVTGRVANDSNGLSEDTSVMIVLYNAVGEPVRYVSAYTDPRNIQPSSSGTFSVKIDVRNISEVSGYAISTESTDYAEVSRIVKMQPFTLTRLQETVKLIDLNVLNENNQLTNAIQVGHPGLFTASLTNNVIERQQFMYILQIKDQNNYVVSLSWVVDFLDVRESRVATVAWVPLESGTYTAQAFVWNNLEDAIPLSFSSLDKTFMVP
jgi:hypothetical protein